MRGLSEGRALISNPEEASSQEGAGSKSHDISHKCNPEIQRSLISSPIDDEMHLSREQARDFDRYLK